MVLTSHYLQLQEVIHCDLPVILSVVYLVAVRSFVLKRPAFTLESSLGAFNKRTTSFGKVVTMVEQDIARSEVTRLIQCGDPGDVVVPYIGFKKWRDSDTKECLLNSHPKVRKALCDESRDLVVGDLIHLRDVDEPYITRPVAFITEYYVYQERKSRET